MKGKALADLLDHALSESGVVAFHVVDQGLVTALCDIIGVLHRRLEESSEPGHSARQIRDAVEQFGGAA